MFGKPTQQTAETNQANPVSKDRSSRELLLSHQLPVSKGKDTGLGDPYRLLHSALSTKK